MCLSATRAAAWPGEAASFFENVSAGHATKREHGDFSLLCRCRPSNVRQMLVDFPFTNTDGLGNLPGGHVLLIQEKEHLLANGLRVTLIAHHQPVESESPLHLPSWIYAVAILSRPTLPAISVISNT